jgi:hypothetical protein
MHIHIYRDTNHLSIHLEISVKPAWDILSNRA